MAKKIFVGLDFGACNIKAASCIGERIKDIKLNKQQSGGVQIPNIIVYEEIKSADNKTKIEKKVGFSAKKSLQDENKVSQIKRKLELKSWSKYIKSLKKELSAENITVDIFSWLKDNISNTLSNKEFETAITVPVCFSEVQKQRIYKSAQKAGFDVKQVITEPFAALFSIEELFEDEVDEYVFIFDFGGSTLDLSLLHVENDGEGEITVTELASSGLHYGGINIDEDVYKDIFLPKYAKEIETIKAADVAKSVDNYKNELIEKVNSLKEGIFIDEDEDSSDTFYIDRNGNRHEFELNRDEFINSFEKNKLKERIIAVMNELFESLEDSDVSKNNVSMIRTFGGTSYIPYFRDILSEYFGEDKFNSEDDFDEDKVYTGIAQGAAKLLSFKNDEDNDIEIYNAIPFNIGVAKGNKFDKNIVKNELYGFETPYLSLLMSDLKASNYVLPIYQTFRNSDDLLITDEDVVFMGNVQLNKDLYTAKDAINFKMKMAEDGLTLTFYQLEGEDRDIVLKETKKLKIGG